MNLKLQADKDIQVEKRRVGRVPVLILKPQYAASKTLGVLWIHGGGYILGMKEMVYMGRAVDLVKKYGVTVISPGYRLAWFHPYPAAVNDCFYVLSYMNQHPDVFGIDKDRIAVGGESAGGGLTVAVCMMARDSGIPVQFQMPLYPMLSNVDTESSRDNHGKVWNTRRNHLGWYVYLRDKANKPVSPYASPVWQTDYHGLPSCYTFVGDGEPFYAETMQYVENLRKSGINAEIDVYHTDVHAFDMMHPDDDISKQAIATFHQQFERQFMHANAETYITLRDRPDLLDQAAEWFHQKWGIPKQTYTTCMNAYVSGQTEYGWYLCLVDHRIVGGMGVIDNDFHERKDLTPNICAAYTEESYRGRGIAGRLLQMTVQDLHTKGISPVYLVTDHSGFYEKYGWEYYCMVHTDGDKEISRVYIYR